MRLKYVILSDARDETRISFSREEILAMLNSIKKDEEEYLKPVVRFLEKMEDEILKNWI